MRLTDSFYQKRRLETLVENRTVYSLNSAELNVYETHLAVERVEFSFSETLLATMMKGKKIVHLPGSQVEFLPGESILFPNGSPLRIDFPEASMENPTQCLALVIQPEKIREVVDYMNETRPHVDHQLQWKFQSPFYHFHNDIAIHQIITRLIFVFTENHPSKDLFADFLLRELIIRLLQSEERHLMSETPENTRRLESRMAEVIDFIRANLHDPISIDLLSRKACMSPTHFFRCFKNELGLSPIDFVNAERIKMAQSLLEKSGASITDISFTCGFNNLSYFNKLFKRTTLRTPSEYRQQYTTRRPNHPAVKQS